MNYLERKIEISEYKEMIQTYLHLNKRINNIIKRQANIRERFENQCFIHSPMAYNEDGSPVHYPSIEEVVINYVDLISVTEKMLKVIKIKKEKFDNFLSKLNNREIYELKYNLNDDLSEMAINEILKIEAQIPMNYKF